MKLRNLTPFLMLDHFHVSKGAVSSHTLAGLHAPNVLRRDSLTTRTAVKLP